MACSLILRLLAQIMKNEWTRVMCVYCDIDVCINDLANVGHKIFIPYTGKIKKKWILNHQSKFKSIQCGGQSYSTASRVFVFHAATQVSLPSIHLDP